MKEKIVNSYVFLGNLPIYNNKNAPGANFSEGCEFIINTRIKYELGIVSMQFINQNQPLIYNTDTMSPEIELDISSLIRFRQLIKIRGNSTTNPTTQGRGNDFILIGSTKLKKSVDYQKPAFVKAGLDYVEIIIENNKIQHKFGVSGNFQLDCLYELLDIAIQQLGSSQISYDIIKNYGTSSKKNHYEMSPNAPIPSYIAPNQGWVMPTPITCSNVPPPMQHQSSTNLVPQAPVPITTSIIPQMPNIPAAPKL